MSAIPPRSLRESAALDHEAKQAFPNSGKVYITGSRPDLRVPMREITLQDTPASFGVEHNPPLTVYDTSGPYTDPHVDVDVRKGLAPLRTAWTAERGDCEQLDQFSSRYSKLRLSDKKLENLRFEHLRTPLRAKAPAAGQHEFALRANQ